MTMFRGLFLTSREPERTALFYQQVAELPLERVGAEGDYLYWRLDRDGLQLAIHEAAAFASYAEPPLRGSNLTHLYFKIDDQPAFLAHLGRLGVQPLAVDEVTITVEDPDGRKVLFGVV